MDTIRSMQVMVRAVELGNLSAVARELGTTQPTVSKILAALERDLGVRLIERTTTKLTATEAARRFYERAKRILEDHSAAVADVRGLTGQASGLLRISAPLGFGEMHLNRICQRFLQLHPKVELELILNDRFVDLVGEGVDLAVRLGGMLPATAVAIDLATSERFFVGSPTYLATHAAIAGIENLEEHEFIRFPWLDGGATVDVTGPDGGRQIVLRGRYSINSALAIRQAANDGLGLAMTPAWLVQDLLDNGTLIRVLPDWQATSHTLRIVYLSRRYQPMHVSAFISFLRSEARALPGLSAMQPLR